MLGDLIKLEELIDGKGTNDRIQVFRFPCKYDTVIKEKPIYEYV